MCVCVCSDNERGGKEEHVEAGGEDGDELLRWGRGFDGARVDHAIGHRLR